MHRHYRSRDEEMAKLVQYLDVYNFHRRRRKTVIDLIQVKVTPRDRQVLNLLVEGCSNKEIATQLNISPRTVKQHLRTLFLRAGIREGRKRVKLATAMFTQEAQL